MLTTPLRFTRLASISLARKGGLPHLVSADRQRTVGAAQEQLRAMAPEQGPAAVAVDAAGSKPEQGLAAVDSCLASVRPGSREPAGIDLEMYMRRASVPARVHIAAVPDTG